jgi:CPA2 family monovalent cation:H+ antiporter-2
MDDLSKITADLLVVLFAGLLAGAVCRRWGVSLLVGYLIVGGLIGEHALHFVSQENRELEMLARGGALLLLFSVGIEFSLGELVRSSRFILLGGMAQMALVAIPLSAICRGFGMSWNAAILAGTAGALSSTVLVFKALSEFGQAATPHGKRAIGILLFQDIALVPLMLLVPLLTQQGESPTLSAYALLAGKSLFFLGTILVARLVIGNWCVPTLAHLRSVELVVLFALCVLGTACYGAFALGIPPAVGALAAGLVLSGNRISKQIDTIILPFRESFAAVFFVTLGTLLNPFAFFAEPVTLSLGLLGMILLKGIAAGVALRLVGLDWKVAFGMGFGLAQLGEFSFLVLELAMASDLIDTADHQRMLFIALGTLILTPQLLKSGLKWTSTPTATNDESALPNPQQGKHVVVIGIGPIGRQVTSRLEILGRNVWLIDLSPINLHPFAQQGFHTIAGDARDPQVLQRAHSAKCGLAVVSVPDDEMATKIVRTLRGLNPEAAIVVRCRFQGNIERVKRAGANAVISEEAEASGALLRWCERFAGTTLDASSEAVAEIGPLER